MQPAEDLEDEFDATPAPRPVVDTHVTDKRNADRFKAQFGDLVRYVPRWATQLYWDGTRWRRNDTRQVERWAAQTIASLWQEVALVSNPDAKKEFIRNILKAESAGRLTSLLQYAYTLEPIVAAPDQFDDIDRTGWLLNVANGTLHLRDPGGDLDTAAHALLRPHDRNHYITRMAGCAYDPQATAPGFEQFLQRITQGRATLASFLQRYAGYSLTGLTIEQCLLLLLGCGANGKSTLIELLRRALGDYAMAADFTTFIAKKTDTGVRNDLARLVGARFVSAIETNRDRSLDEALVKQMTGGDTVTARFLFAEFFDFKPAFKLWLAANHQPRVRGTDHAIWRRIKCAPFDVVIREDEKDEHLCDRLTATELPGILNWMVRGCLLWQRDGLGDPEEVRIAGAEYRADMDTLAPFIEERCVVGDAYSAPAGDLYSAYKGWAADSGERTLSQQKFGRYLRERGFTKDRDTLTRRFRWSGIGVAA